MNQRTVTVFNTQLAKSDEYRVSGSTFEDLLRETGISTNNMMAVIGETEQEITSLSTNIPNTDFTLFLMPRQVKSGSSTLSSSEDDDSGEDYDYGFDTEDDDDNDEFGELRPMQQVREIPESYTREQIAAELDDIGQQIALLGGRLQMVAKMTRKIKVEVMVDTEKEARLAREAERLSSIFR